MVKKTEKKSVFSVMWDGKCFVKQRTLEDAVSCAKDLAKKYPLSTFSVQIKTTEVSTYHIN